MLKVAVSQDFLEIFSLLIEPIWSPDKQVTFFFFIRCCGDILEISDSAQANTARSQTLRIG